MAPKISIVIATYNAAKTLDRCLSSIAQQTFQDKELIIIDGGSTDGTIRILEKSLGNISYLHSGPDKGIYDAWNHALNHARGEYICFLGADDTLHSPGILTEIFDSVGGKKYDLVTGRGKLVHSDRFPDHTFGQPWNHRKVTRRMTICHPGALHNRNLFARFGTFDTSYRIAADYEFLLRLPADSHTLHLDRIIVDVADGGVSRSHRWKMLAERYRAQAHCPRVGRLRATLNYIDKLWRIPVAHVLGMPN